MNNKFYTVEEISEVLDMHTKTVQRYIREGKIKATKVGKAWRVFEKDFKEFMNINYNSDRNGAKNNINPSVGYDKVKVSSVVDIEVSNSDEGINITNMLISAMNGKSEDFGKTSLNIQFIESESKLRIMLWGNIKFMEIMMGFIAEYINRV